MSLERTSRTTRINAAMFCFALAVSSCRTSGAEPPSPDDIDDGFRGGIAPPPPNIPAEVAMLRAQPLDLSESTPVGTLPGGGSVDASGQANYSIPLQLVPGVASMTPELAITYDSDRGNGTLGVGFALSGQSSVRRCTKTLLDDCEWAAISWTNADALSLDGDRLVRASGVYGADGSVYRLRHDPSRRVLLHGSMASITSSFEVFQADGRIDKAFHITGPTSLTVREWMGTQSFEAQTSFGLKALDNISKGIW